MALAMPNSRAIDARTDEAQLSDAMARSRTSGEPTTRSSESAPEWLQLARE